MEAWEQVVQRGISFRKQVLRPRQQKALKTAAKKSMLNKLLQLESLLDRVSIQVISLPSMERQLQVLLNMLRTLSVLYFGYVVQN